MKLEMPSLSAGKSGGINLNALLDQFRYMDPNDPGAWPLLPRVTVLLVVFLAWLAAAWWFVWSDQLSALENARQEEVNLKNDFLMKKRQAINLDLYTQQLAEMDRSFGALLKQLPNRAEVEALLIEVNQSGLGRGLQFELFRPGAEQVKDFYAELPVTLKVNGSYHDIGAFAADIARLPRIVTLNDISLTPVKGGELLSLDATAKTFRYLDENELLQQKRPAKAGAKGAAK
jgi:type IV pilus assembly protein PilO